VARSDRATSNPSTDRYGGGVSVEVAPDGSGVPLTGPGNGVSGASWLSWNAAVTTSSVNRTMSVMAVPRRTAGG
jgi:hypothetical protein